MGRGILTKRQRDELTTLLTDVDAAIARRAQAMLWWYEGRPTGYIGTQLHVGPGTVRGWVSRYADGGASSLRRKPHNVRVKQPALTPADVEVANAADEFYAELGGAIMAARIRRGWTRTDLVAAMGVAYTAAQVRRWEVPPAGGPVRVLPLVMVCRALQLSLDEVTARAADGTINRLPTMAYARETLP
jgi:transposase